MIWTWITSSYTLPRAVAQIEGGDVVHLIQGFFCQTAVVIDANPYQQNPGSQVASQQLRYMYAGVIFPDPDSPSGLAGNMTDHFGDSRIFDVKLASETIQFAKQYEKEDRPDTIHYDLKRRGNIWIGTYDGIVTDSGPTKCIITEVPEELLFL